MYKILFQTITTQQSQHLCIIPRPSIIAINKATLQEIGTYISMNMQIYGILNLQTDI